MITLEAKSNANLVRTQLQVAALRKGLPYAQAERAWYKWLAQQGYSDDEIRSIESYVAWLDKIQSE